MENRRLYISKLRTDIGKWGIIPVQIHAKFQGQNLGRQRIQLTSQSSRSTLRTCGRWQSYLVYARPGLDLTLLHF